VVETNSLICKLLILLIFFQKRLDFTFIMVYSNYVDALQV